MRVLKFIQYLLLGGLLCLPATLPAQTLKKTGVSISFDGRTMVLTGVIDTGKTMFYQAGKNAMWEWSTPKPMDSLNSYIKNATVVKDPFLSPDGARLYFSANMPNSKGLDIYYCEKEGDSWKAPIRMGEPINSNEEEESPSFTADGRYMYFTRRAATPKPKPDDELCRKVYYATCNAQGEWQTPKPLVLSNEGCEAYPLISADGNTLFFASCTLPAKSKQKYDIYYVKKLHTGLWSMPQSVYELNTECIEISPSIDYRTKQLCAIRNEQKKEQKSTVVQANMPANVSLQTFTTINRRVLANNAPVDATITINKVLPIIEPYIELKPKADGTFKAMLPNGTLYSMKIYVPECSQYATLLDLKEIVNNSDEQRVDINLSKEIELLLNVYDKEAFIALDALISVSSNSNGKTPQNVAPTGIPGQFKTKLPIGKAYQITIQHSGFTPYQFPIDLSGEIYFTDYISEDIALAPEKKPYTLHVDNLSNGSPIEAYIEVNNTLLDENIEAQQVKTGEYTVNLRNDSQYKLNFTQQGFSFDNRLLSTNSKTSSMVNIKLVPLTRQTSIALASIAFEGQSEELTVDMYPELNSLATLMLDNPEVRIEIACCTDTKIDDDYAITLTQKRAAHITDYLTLKGVTKDRITTVGYGKTCAANLQYTGSKIDNKNKVACAWFTIVEPARKWADIPAPVQEKKEVEKKPTRQQKPIKPRR